MRFWITAYPEVIQSVKRGRLLAAGLRGCPEVPSEEIGFYGTPLALQSPQKTFLDCSLAKFGHRKSRTWPSVTAVTFFRDPYHSLAQEEGGYFWLRLRKWLAW